MRGFFKKTTLSLVLLTTLFALFACVPVAEAAKGTTGGNAPPVITLGETGSLTVNQDSSGTISLKATDKNKDTMSWKIITQGSIGTAEVGPVTNSRGTSTAPVNYKPVSGYSGSDSFVVQVNDGKGGTDTITIYVTITPAPIAQPTISYVSLGDSIATGTVYSGNIITSYVNYFYQYLQAQNPSATVNLTKLATDGDRTNELYDRLGLGDASATAAEDPALISAVTKANIITISIGGNDLMQAAKDSSALGGYNFNYINTTVAEQGLQDFQKQWLPIVQKIKQLNPNAQLIVNTTYNPYNETDTSLHSTVDSYLFRGDAGLNDLILNNSSLGYSVANVYQYFDDNYRNDMGAVTYFYPTNWWETITRNPHPNSIGQNLIANLCEEQYKPIN